MGQFKIVPDHVGISVADLNEAIAWYSDILFFQLERWEYNEKIHSKVAFLKNDGFRIELFEHDDSKKPSKERFIPDLDIMTQGTKHICFHCNNMSELYLRCQEKSVDVVLGPVSNSHSDMMFIRDNSGTLIEIISLHMKEE